MQILHKNYNNVSVFKLNVGAFSIFFIPWIETAMYFLLPSLTNDLQLKQYINNNKKTENCIVVN